MPTAGQWKQLTALPEKRDVLRTDLYFRECFADVAGLLGSSAVKVLAPLALLSFKPDAVVGRRMRLTLEFSAEHGFVPVAFEPMRQTRHTVRELWRYDWNAYTIDRLEWATMMNTSTDTLVMILRDTRFDGSTPGSVRLGALKGPAAREKRHEGHLRTRLDPPNGIMNFVHVGDEPADVVRELGIFLPRSNRRHLLSHIAAQPHRDATGRLLEAIELLEAHHPPHDLNFSASLARMQSAGAIDAAFAARLNLARHEGTKVPWDELRSSIDTRIAASWDFVVVTCELLFDERDAPAHLLPDPAPLWAARRVNSTVADAP